MDEEGDIADGPQGPMIYRGGRWVQFGGQQPVVTPLPMSPQQQAEEARKATNDARDAARLGYTGEDQERQNTKARIDNPQALRKEFAALPEVKAYNVAVQQLAQALNTGEGAQADLALTYAFAKAMDPDSVVREAEQQMITTSQPWFQAMVENTQKQFGMDGAGNYSPQARAALRQQIIRSVDSREKIYSGKRGEFGQLAQRYGIDPYEVVGEHSGETFRKQFRGYDEQRRADGANVGALDKPNVWEQDTPETKRAASGATRNEYSADLSKRVDALINTGASKQEIDAMLNVNGFPPLRDDQWGPVQKWRQDNPGKPYTGGNVNRSVANTAMEQLSGSGLGAALAGAGNMGSFGGVQALAPEQYAAISQANPGLTMGGEIAGAIAGTQGLGMLGRGVAQRLSPKLLSGGSGAQFGRNLATDATYGAGFGGVTEGDPLTGAAFAAGGSALGQGIGGVLGRAAGGLRVKPEAQALASRGVGDLTVAQRLGGVPKSIEDRMTSVPIVGDMINARRLEGLQSFNRAAFDEAGSPIGATTRNIGEEGVADLRTASGGAYDQATQGVNVPLDREFVDDISKARSVGSALPSDLAAKFNLAMQNRVRPAVDMGQMSGEQYQQAMRGLKGYKAEHPKAGFEGDYRDALSGVQDALKGQMMRGGGSGVVEGLGKADQSYRMVKVLEDAVRRARNGTRSGEVQTFMPSQLTDAATANARKFPGARPFAELADAGQSVLPSAIPDSGTMGRLTQLALPAALGGTGYAAGGGEGAAGAVTLGALLAAMSTKGGQKALNKLLIERSDPLKRFGATIGKKKGLFGSALVPLALEAQ